MSPLVPPVDGPSSSQVKRAGSLVRRARREGVDSACSLAALAEAIQTIEQHRATFKTPLVTANNGLRSMVRTLGLDGKVTQRLKRMATILDKLSREPTLALDRMQDIGGCRVVLPRRTDVLELAAHIERVKTPTRISDYIAEPRRSGYRGIHIIVEYGRSCPRPVEIQLRTVAMHQWATTVEDISGNQGINYKMDGTAPMQRFLECYARLLDCIDSEIPFTDGLVDEYETLLARAFGREPST